MRRQAAAVRCPAHARIKEREKRGKRPMSFDVLQEKIIAKQNPTVAGLDARIEYVPSTSERPLLPSTGWG